MPHDTIDNLDLKGHDTPPAATTLEELRAAPEVPIGSRLAPRKPDLKKSERDSIAEMVVEDFKRDWDSRSEWREERRGLVDRYRMKSISKTDPFEGCANVRLPTTMIAVHATQARMMASIHGNDPAVKIKGVNAFGRENKNQAETLMHWDARVRDGGDFKLLYRVTHSVCAEGARPIYTYWDRDSRFVQDTILVYINDLTGEIVTDEAGNPFPVDEAQPQIQLPDGTTARAAMKVIERESIVYDAPRSIDLNPEDFLVPYDAKGIQWPESAHVMMIERETFNRVKQKKRTGRYYLTRNELKDILNFARTGGDSEAKGKSEHDQSLDDIEGKQEVAKPRLPEQELDLVRWFGRYDLNNDGIDEEVIFLVQPDTRILVWWAYLDDVYQHGKRPFAYPRFRLQPGRFDGFGLGQILKSIDDAVNALFNIALDWGKIQNMPYFFYVPGMIEDERIKLKPGEGVPVRGKGAVEFPGKTGSIDFAISLLGVLQSYVERVTLVSDETVGRQSEIAKTRATKGGTLAILGEGNIGFELGNRLVLDEIEEMYVQRFQLYQQYMPDNMEIAVLEGEEWSPRQLSRDNIRGQYQFEIEADAVSGNKLARFDLSVTLFQIISQYLIQVYPPGVVELARKLIRDSGDKDVEKILPEEVVQMVQQAQEAEAQMRQQEAQVDMATKLAQAEVMEARADSEKEKQQAEVFQEGIKGVKLLDEMMNPKVAAK